MRESVSGNETEITMFTRNVRRGTIVALPIAVLAITLIACTAAPTEPDDTAEQEALAAKFVACLTDEGQTAKILEGGMVGLLLPEGVGDDGEMAMGGGPGEGEPSERTMVMISEDEDGTWQAANNAAGYPEEGGMRDAWEACETELPDFEQPEPDLSEAEGNMISMEDQLEASLEFADCARENGYADFADPNDHGQLSIPPVSEDEFRALLDACADTLEGVGLPMTQESIEGFDFDWMAVMEDYFDNIMVGGGTSGRTP
jgi:hypothetical protein